MYGCFPFHEKACRAVGGSHCIATSTERKVGDEVLVRRRRRRRCW